MLKDKTINNVKKGYFGLRPIFSIILAFIPVTSLICGIITRAKNGYTFGAILNFILFPIFWIADLFTIVLVEQITFMNRGKVIANETSAGTYYTKCCIACILIAITFSLLLFSIAPQADSQLVNDAIVHPWFWVAFSGIEVVATTVVICLFVSIYRQSHTKSDPVYKSHLLVEIIAETIVLLVEFCWFIVDTIELKVEHLEGALDTFRDLLILLDYVILPSCAIALFLNLIGVVSKLYSKHEAH